MEFMENEYHSLKRFYLFRARGNLKLIEFFFLNYGPSH